MTLILQGLELTGVHTGNSLHLASTEASLGLLYLLVVLGPRVSGQTEHLEHELSQ